MTTEQRRFIVVAVSVALCAPVLRGALSGDLYVSSAAVRVAAALVLAWLGVHGLHHLLDGYHGQGIDAAPIEVEPGEERPPAAVAEDRRRRPENAAESIGPPQ